MKKFMKKFNSLDTWVKYLFGTCLFLLVISLFWPRRSIGVRIVPVPGSPYYKAVLEGFSDDDKVQKVLNDNKPTFVAFVANWCGHCKNLKKDWLEFEKDNEDKNCNIISIDCANDNNKDLAEKHKVKGYPTIRFYPNGLKDISTFESYEGGRTKKELENFISKKC